MIHALGLAFPLPLPIPSTDTHTYTKDPPLKDCSSSTTWAQNIYSIEILRSDKYTRSIEQTQTGQDKLRSLSTEWDALSVEQALVALEDGWLLHPSVEHIVSVLHKCAKKRNPTCASRLHAVVHRHGLMSHPSVGSQLIILLVDCGCMQLAERAFDKIRNWDEASLNLLFTEIIRCREPLAALILYNKLVNPESLHFDLHIYVELLKVCAEFRFLEQGCKLHAHILAKKKLLNMDMVIGNTLVSMYAKCDDLAKAQEVFDGLPLRNVVSWNALIAGYARQGRGEEALTCFEQMQQDGISPSRVSFICGLKACSSMGDVSKGQEMHAEIARQGLLKTDSRLCGTLMDMYAKCGLITKAHEVFKTLENRSAIAWNTLIAGYTEHGHGIEALQCVEQMQIDGVSPDPFTFASILKACGILQAIDRGLEMHAKVVKGGLLERDFMIGSALVDMYAKCGLLGKAQVTFDNLPFRDVISWTSLIAGYAEHGPGEKALNCFDEMQREGVSPNAVTFLCSLKACSCLGAIAKGSEIHSLIAKKGLLERDLLVGSTLVDMYGKCGALHKAEEVFDKLAVRDVMSWNALLAGYAQAGKSERVFLCYDKMRDDGTQPNVVTFTILLNACNHLGLVDKGLDYCKEMSEDFAIVPTVDHLACMVDLLGRSGLLEKVVATIMKMPISPDRVVWLTVLSACRKWKNVEVGRWAFEHAVQLDYEDPSPYVYMGMIYADAGMQEAAKKVDSLRLQNQAWNKDAECCSWRDVTGFLHRFTTSNRHLLQKDVYVKLEELCNQTDGKVEAVQAVKDGLTPHRFCEHNERFAVAFALVNTCGGSSIHIKKNTRICNECHVAIARVSYLEQRKIFVEGNNHHHVFHKGLCSCKDYW